MPEIEFVDDAAPRPHSRRPPPVPAEDVAATGHTSAGRFRRETVRTWGPAVLATVSAVLALIAPWHTLYSLSQSNSGLAFSFDGWGRVHARGQIGGEHGTRYGVLLCVAAGLLLVGAVLSVHGRPPRRSWAGTAATGLVIGGVGLLAGSVGAAVLQVVAQSDSFAAEAREDPQNSDPGFHVAAGGTVWFGLAAIVVGLAAVVLPLVLRPRVTREPEVESAPPLALPVPERPRYVPHADDELLDV